MDTDAGGNTGGSAEPDSDNGWNDTNTGTLWGWLDSVVSGLKTVWETLTDLPGLIANALSTAFNAVVDAIVSLPQLILDGIKAIFVPDMEEMKTEFASFVDKINPGTMDNSANTLGGILESPEREPDDFVANLDLGNSVMGNLKFNGIVLADMEWMKQGITYFRPIINAFIAWLLGMFYYRELLSFIGQAPNMAQARATAGEHRANQTKASKPKG